MQTCISIDGLVSVTKANSNDTESRELSSDTESQICLDGYGIKR